MAKPRMLLVDDTEMIRNLVVRFVGADFESIEQAKDGQGALAVLHERLQAAGPLPNIIVSDLDMAPGICGDEFAREVAKDRRLAAIPFLLSSSEPDVRKIAEELGVHAFEKRGAIGEIRNVILRLVGGGAP
jgi:CheY-like chemotaxis protein